MKHTLLLLSCLILTSCVTNPASNYTPEEISNLTDSQLCNFANHQGKSDKITKEVIIRDINCDPALRYCIENGFGQDKQTLLQCIAVKNQQIAQENAIEIQKRQAYSQALQNIGNQQANRNAYTPPTPVTFGKKAITTSCQKTLLGMNCTTN